jgi:hypothetical protein
VAEISLQLLLENEPPPRTETLLERAGAHTVVVTTVLPELAISLCSAYLADLRGRLGATHLYATPAQQEITQRVLAGLPGQTIARGCLLDHAAELHTRLADAGHPARVELPDSALDAAERLWTTPQSS